MITINLLPVREWRRKEAVRRQVSVYFLSMVLLILVLVATGITLQGKVHLQRQELARLEQEKKKLSYVDKKIKQVKEARKKVEDKFKAIEKLQQGRTLSVMLLDELVTAIPIDRLWFKNFKLTHRTIDLTGYALDNHTVALFMKRLDSSPFFNKVNLSNTETYFLDENLKEYTLKDFNSKKSRSSRGNQSKGRDNKEFEWHKVTRFVLSLSVVSDVNRSSEKEEQL